MAQARDPDPALIDGGSSAAKALAHQAVNEAFVKRVAGMWDTLVKDYTVTHGPHGAKKPDTEIITRFNNGYRLALAAREKALELIEQLTP